MKADMILSLPAMTGETIYNAMRLANVAQQQGDEVSGLHAGQRGDALNSGARAFQRHGGDRQV